MWMNLESAIQSEVSQKEKNKDLARREQISSQSDMPLQIKRSSHKYAKWA